MSRGTFRSQNKVGETFSFQTNSSSADTFTSQVTFDSGLDRVHWNWGDGSLLDGDNNPSHTYSDNGSVKTVVMGTNRLRRLKTFAGGDCNFYHDLDMSGWDNLSSFNISNSFTNNNLDLTGITHTYSPQVFTGYIIQRNNIVGNLDLSMFPNLGGTFATWQNPNLTGITHTTSTQLFTSYRVDLCDITGVHDMSMLTNLSGIIRLNNNSITNVIHTGNSNIISQYYIDNNNLTGNLDLTMFPNLGGSFRAYTNSNLTGITHTASSQTFTSYLANTSDITGTYDLTMFPNLGGVFNMSANANLTEVSHTASTQTLSQYYLNGCDITGTHDLSMFPNLEGVLWLYSNSNLTGVTLPTTSGIFSQVQIHNSNLTGVLDVSMLSNLGGRLQVSSNSFLTGVTFPLTSQTFKNNVNSINNYAFTLNNCDMGYSSFLPLSGATLDVNYVQGATIDLSNNNMLTSEVNHYLVDFDNLSTNLNPSGWTGITLDISGTNAAPDSTSGGFDGIAALSSLTGGTNNWTITTS